MDGFCQNPECHNSIQWSGKERKYCSDSCRQHMYRVKKTRQALEDLRERWRSLCPCAVEDLEALYSGYGLRAAQLATHIVEAEIKHRS